MIRGFFGLLLIVGAVTALTQGNLGCCRNRSTGILDRTTVILNRPAGFGARRAADFDWEFGDWHTFGD
jgi:hypothetical protein